MKMPKTLYVRIAQERNEPEYLIAELSPEDAVEGDGPTTIGVYRLVETVKRKKVVAPA